MRNERRDVVRDHSFDGIQEFDNQLPRWWVGTFVLTIALGLYWWTARHTFGLEPGTRALHAQEWEALMKLQEEKFGKPPTDAEVEALLADEAALADGAKTFETTCFACHGKLGEGKIGPNLTDDYWIHGGKPGQVANTISKGVTAKGMPAWRSSMKREQILNVTAYVVSLQGSNPPGAKEPQGTQEP